MSTAHNFDAILNAGHESPRGVRLVAEIIQFCHFKAELRTKYKPEYTEKMRHVVHVLGKYFSGKRPQRFLDPDILDMRGQGFEISGSLVRSPHGVS